VGSSGTIRMGKNIRQHWMDVRECLCYSLPDFVLVHRVHGGRGPASDGRRGTVKKPLGTRRADISLGLDGIGACRHFRISHVRDGRGGLGA
jgi:hypothetical protein